MQRVQASSSARTALESGMGSFYGSGQDLDQSRSALLGLCVDASQRLREAADHLDFISQQLALWRIIYEI